jgi:Fe-S oxidoreductase
MRIANILNHRKGLPGYEQHAMRDAKRNAKRDGGLDAELDLMPDKKKVLLHGHCYQKAQPPHPDGFLAGTASTIAMLEAAGYQVTLVDSGCCGMAGAFGYEVEHYEISMQVGELKLFPAVRSAGKDVIVAACGVSCQAQISDGTGRQVVHPITLI